MPKCTYVEQIIKTLTHNNYSDGHRTAWALRSVKCSEGLIIITGLDTGAAPELSLTRTLSEDYTHILASTHIPIYTYEQTIQMGNQTSASGGKMFKLFPSNHGVYWVHMKMKNKDSVCVCQKERLELILTIHTKRNVAVYELR